MKRTLIKIRQLHRQAKLTDKVNNDTLASMVSQINKEKVAVHCLSFLEAQTRASIDSLQSSTFPELDAITETLTPSEEPLLNRIADELKSRAALVEQLKSTMQQQEELRASVKSRETQTGLLLNKIVDLDKALDSIRKAFNVPSRSLSRDPLVESLPEPLYAIHSKFSGSGFTAQATSEPSVIVSIDSEEISFTTSNVTSPNPLLIDILHAQFGEVSALSENSADVIAAALRSAVAHLKSIAAERARILKNSDLLEIGSARVTAEGQGLRVRMVRPIGDVIEIAVLPGALNFQVEISKTANGKTYSSKGVAVDPVLATAAAHASLGKTFTDAVKSVARSLA